MFEVENILFFLSLYLSTHQVLSYYNIDTDECVFQVYKEQSFIKELIEVDNIWLLDYQTLINFVSLHPICYENINKLKVKKLYNSCFKLKSNPKSKIFIISVPK